MTINQIAGIGDIIFLEPMYRHFWKRDGIKPTLWVRNHLMHLQPYFDSVIMAPCDDKNIDDMNMRHDYFPARFANQIYRGYGPHDHHDAENMMLDKYRLASIDTERWKDIHLAFNERKAMDLYSLEMESGMISGDYICVNENSGVGNVQINPSSNLPVVKMWARPGYSVIDWYLVMAMAKQNHHVSTSTFYLFQAMFNKYGGKLDTEIFIYPRPNGDVDGVRGISNLKPSFDYTITL